MGEHWKSYIASPASLTPAWGVAARPQYTEKRTCSNIFSSDLFLRPTTTDYSTYLDSTAWSLYLIYTSIIVYSSYSAACEITVIASLHTVMTFSSLTVPASGVTATIEMPETNNSNNPPAFHHLGNYFRPPRTLDNGRRNTLCLQRIMRMPPAQSLNIRQKWFIKMYLGKTFVNLRFKAVSLPPRGAGKLSCCFSASHWCVYRHKYL